MSANNQFALKQLVDIIYLQPEDPGDIGPGQLWVDPLTGTINVRNSTSTGWIENTSGGGGTPSGTGFVHVTAGVQDAAAALVVNADVDAAAAISQSKISGLVSDLAGKQSALVNSAGLLAALSDETGTGLAVFNTSPTFVTPVLGVAAATSLGLSGTAGGGFVTFPSQSSPPSAPASGYREYADATGRRSWIRASDGFTRTWDATLTANRVYTLPDATTTIVGTDATQTLTNKTFGNPITITQGTITADAPQIDGTVTWNNAGIVGPVWKMNVTATSANAAANLVQLQVDSTDKVVIDRTGRITLGSGGANIGFYVGTTGAIYWSSVESVLNFRAGSAQIFLGSSDGCFVSNLIGTSTGHFGLSPSSVIGGDYADTKFFRDGARIHAWRDGTSANVGRIYNTYTSSTSYERLALDWQTTANLARIMTQKGSGGGTARAMALGTDSVDRLTIGAAGHITITEANDFILGTTTGTKIGTATTQKLAFYNATPIVQGASVADATGGAVIDAEARTAINALISRIEGTGLIATV